MKKETLLLIALIISLKCYSQITFEKGYFIDNDNNRNECLIKNNDWKYNPNEFEYKLSEDGDYKKATIDSVKEFGIYNTSKYTRNEVNIDRSNDNINNLSYNENPIYQNEILFLKVIIEGNANLYEYSEPNFIRFFYSSKHKETEQLIFKKYESTRNEIRENQKFKQQLWGDLKCNSINLNKIKSLDYNKNNLTDLFIEYHNCLNASYHTYGSTQKTKLVNINIRPGINISSLSIQRKDSTTINSELARRLAFRFGIETEIFLPYNKNKWALIIEPTYQYYKSETALGNLKTKVNYNSIELPIGARHYYYISNKSKLFINASFVFDFTTNSTIVYESKVNLKINTRNNFAFGIGYKQNNKYSIELRYLSNREIISNYVYLSSKYSTFSVIFGYNLLKK